MSNTTIFVTLNAVTCVTCGVVFGLSTEHQRGLRDSRRTFYCPAGHFLAFNGKTEAEKLRDQLVATEKRLQYARDDRDAADRRASAARGQMTKLKKRAHAGVCLHCNRTFSQLAKHMATKHATEPVE